MLLHPASIPLSTDEDVSDNISNSNVKNGFINYPKQLGSRIMHNHPSYFCKNHPNFKT
jgi:hypothetical protein